MKTIKKIWLGLMILMPAVLSAKDSHFLDGTWFETHKHEELIGLGILLLLVVGIGIWFFVQSQLDKYKNKHNLVKNKKG